MERPFHISDIIDGKTILRGTVNKHEKSKYTNAQETMLNRVKILQIDDRLRALRERHLNQGFVDYENEYCDYINELQIHFTKHK